MSVRVSFLGLGLDEMPPDEAVETVRRFWHAGAKRRVFFVNAHCVNIAAKHQRYRDALEAADLVLADGSGVLLASKILRVPVQHNLNGTDLVPLVCAAAAAEGKSVFLLGAQPGIPDLAARQLQLRFPGLRVVGTHDGYFKPEESAQVIAQINAARPDMLLVALGVPLQELWITEHLAELDVPVCLGVGALFDFLSNTFPRAPRVFRRLGLEWAYRLYLEPRRLWRRYLIGNTAFLTRVVLSRLLNTSIMLPPSLPRPRRIEETPQPVASAPVKVPVAAGSFASSGE